MTGWDDWTLTKLIIYSLDEGGMAGSTSMYGFRSHFFGGLNQDGKERVTRLLASFIEKIANYDGKFHGHIKHHRKTKRFVDSWAFPPRPQLSETSPVANEEHLAIILRNAHFVERLLYATIDLEIEGASETGEKLIEEIDRWPKSNHHCFDLIKQALDKKENERILVEETEKKD